MSSNTNIGNTPVNQGYVQLIHTGETGGIDGTLRTLYDGDGTASDLQIASNKVKVSTELYIGSDTLQEYIQDTVGAMLVTNASHTNLSAAYDDAGDGAIDLTASGEVTLTGTQTLTNKTLASPTFTGTANGVNLTLSGDLTVNGTTTTLDTTNLKVTDNLIELNQGVSSNANDSGIIIERGSTGDNAIIMWDESADKFTLGTTTATADATGNITITTGTLVASTFEGNLTGNVTGSASLNLLTSNNLSDLANAATARTNLGVDAAGTDNSTDVTLAGTLDYITISGQEITRNAINLTTDVTGTLPVGNGGTGLTSISTLLNSNVTPTSLGLVIGTDVQAQDTLLQDIADFSLSNPSQDGYLIAYSDAEPQLELVAPGISFNGSTANGLLTYGNSTTADVETDLVYTSTGLGVGVTNPSRKLQVAGAIELSTADNTLDTNNFALRRDSGGGGNIDVPGNMTINLDANNNETTAQFEICHDGGSTPVFKVQENGYTTALRYYIEDTGAMIYRNSNDLELITYSGYDINLMPSGNVGIGTSSPGRTLQVNGDGIVRLVNDSGDPGIDFNSSDMQLRYRSASDKLQFYSYGTSTNVMTIQKSNGNVGIGTTSPDYELDVAGDIGVDHVIYHNGDGNTYHQFTTDRQRFVVGSELLLDLYEDGTQDYVKLGDGGDVDINLNDDMFVEGSSGNVGIGVSSPDTLLHVNEDDAATAFQVTGGSGGAKIASFVRDVGVASPYAETYIHAGSGDPQITFRDVGNKYFSIGIDDSANSFKISDNSAVGTNDRLTIDTSGNVGIGINSPTAKLEVNSSDGTETLRLHKSDVTITENELIGEMLFTTADTTLNSDRKVIGAIKCFAEENFSGANANEGSLQFFTANATDLRNSGSPTPRMVIDENGFVGIGTASPGYKVDVSGDAKISSGSLGVGVNPNSTDGRGDFSNDVVAFSTSDKRLKENIKPLDSALDKVLKINGVEFDWKELTEEEKKTIHGNEGHDVGVIAQEIEEVLPEVVTTRYTGYKAVKYEKIVPLLIEAIKEQQKQIEELKNG